jgi:hypothetical protein
MARTNQLVTRQTRFLDSLRAGWSVSQAVDDAKISRAVVYQWREQDSKFAAAWEAAQLIGTEALADGLEDTASIRAKGIRVKVFDEKTGEVIGERISDRMLEFMLKAKRPQIYARTDSNNQTVTVVMPTLQDMQAKYKASASSRQPSKATSWK